MASYHIKPDQNRPRRSNRAAQRRLGSSRYAFLLSLLFSIACFLSGCGSKPGVAADSPDLGPPGTNAPPSAAATKPEYAKLLGKWERPDGGYILEIKSVSNSGAIEAGYFNPDPIQVSKALVFQKDGGTKIFIELRDVNYPGCTYSLSYDPQADQLYGQYYQAAVDQTYDIAFTRVK